MIPWQAEEHIREEKTNENGELFEIFICLD